MKTKFIIPLLTVCVLTIIIAGGNVFGSEEERGERGERHENNNYLPVVDNAVYKQECSSCHFLYMRDCFLQGRGR